MKKPSSRKLAAIIAAAALALTLVFTPIIALGDAGGFAGGSDFGGGGGGSSFGGGGSSYNYGSSGGYGYSSDSSSEGFSGLEVIVVVIVIIIIISSVRRNSKGSSATRRPAGASETPQSQLSSIAALKQQDPAFDEAATSEKIGNVYVRMQNAWTAKDFSPMRPYFSDALFAQFERQLNDLSKRNQTNYVDNIAVLDVSLRGWYVSGDTENLVAKVRTRIIDYTVDDRTGQVVSGDNQAEKFMTYEYVLTRPIGTITQGTDAEMTQTNCPNCGAALNVNQTAKCPYCDTIITVNAVDWVISQIKGISQETVR